MNRSFLTFFLFTCYYQTKVSSAIPTQDEAAEKQKKASKKKYRKETAETEDDLPF